MRVYILLLAVLPALSLAACKTTGVDAIGAGYVRGQQGYAAPLYSPPPPRTTTCTTVYNTTRCTTY